MKTINYNGNEYTQVQKRTAERLYNEGVDVYIIPCKARAGVWYNLASTDLLRCQGMPFMQAINHFEYYNCNSEAGTYCHFYIIK